MGLQAAIAHVLVDDELRRQLVTQPEKIQSQFVLSAEEMRLLCSSNPSHLDRMSHGIRAKRLDFLEKGLPCTVRAIGRQVLVEFARLTIPRTEAEEQGRVLAEARRFMAFVQNLPNARLPVYLRDLGEFELNRLELGSMIAAPSPATSQALSDESVVCLVRHVRICKFQFDVVALTESEDVSIGAPPAGSTAVLLRKDPVRGIVETYRIGESVYAAFSLCTTPRRLSDLYLSIAPLDTDAESRRSRLFESVRCALEKGILTRETA
ncbi:MAG TPA: hypothetical protein VF011_05620 [Terriglobales bacterium]